MMSRGKVGSIFIDNNLTNIIGQNKESLSKENAPNLREAIEPFIEAKLDVLNSLDLVPNEEFEQEITGEETTEEETEEGEVLSEDESLQVEDPVEPQAEVDQDRKDMIEALGDKTEEIVQ